MYRISMPHVCRVEWVKPMTSTNGKPTVLPMRSLAANPQPHCLIRRHLMQTPRPRTLLILPYRWPGGAY